MFARFIPEPPRGKKNGLYVGTVTSTKLDKTAVRRNRMRRRTREALRLAADQAAGNVSAQLLLLPRSSSLNADFDELLSDARALLRFLPSS